MTETDHRDHRPGPSLPRSRPEGTVHTRFKATSRKARPEGDPSTRPRGRQARARSHRRAALDEPPPWEHAPVPQAPTAALPPPWLHGAGAGERCLCPGAGPSENRDSHLAGVKWRRQRFYLESQIHKLHQGEGDDTLALPRRARPEPRAARRLPRRWMTEHMLGAQTWADDGRTTALGLTGIARGFTDVVHCKFSLLHATPQTSPPPQCIKGFLFFGN